MKASTDCASRFVRCLSLSACNTVEGAGKDVKARGRRWRTPPRTPSPSKPTAGPTPSTDPASRHHSRLAPIMTLVDEIKLLLEAPTMNARDVRTHVAPGPRRDPQARARHVRIGERGRAPGAVAPVEARARHARARRGEGSLRRAAQARGRGPAGRSRTRATSSTECSTTCSRSSCKSRKTETDEWKAHAKVLSTSWSITSRKSTSACARRWRSTSTTTSARRMGRRFTGGEVAAHDEAQGSVGRDDGTDPGRHSSTISRPREAAAGELAR